MKGVAAFFKKWPCNLCIAYAGAQHKSTYQRNDDISAVHGVTKNQTQLITHTHTLLRVYTFLLKHDI